MEEKASPPLRPTHRAVSTSLERRVEESRRQIVQALRAGTDLAKHLKDFRSGDLYTVSGKSNVLVNLQRNADGSVMGFARDGNGQFLGHARWTKASAWGPRALSSASVLAGHAALIQIGIKLDQIDAKVDRVLQALADDRRQELRGALDTVRDALDCAPENQQALLTSTAPALVQAVRKEMQALSRIIETAPNPPLTATKEALWDTSDDTRKALREAQSSFLAVVDGIWAICQLYLSLDEPRIAWQRTAELFKSFSDAGLREASRKARLIRHASSDDAPEIFWQHAIAMTQEASNYAVIAAEQAAEGTSNLLALEFSIDEIDIILADEAR